MADALFPSPGHRSPICFLFDQIWQRFLPFFATAEPGSRLPSNWSAFIVPVLPLGSRSHLKTVPFGTMLQIGLSTSCSRFSKKFLVISQKVAHKKSYSKYNQKLLFVTNVAQKLLEKTETFFGLMLTCENCTTKI